MSKSLGLLISHHNLSETEDKEDLSFFLPFIPAADHHKSECRKFVVPRLAVCVSWSGDLVILRGDCLVADWRIVPPN